MIFTKGELVKVINVNDEDLNKFIGMIGKVITSSKLRGDTPFVILFFIDEKPVKQSFSHTELRLINGVEDLTEKQNYLNQLRKFNDK